ncbi:MAG: FlgD immunoglobulin-like domain containing protein [Candidatus Glassbacteria bacterium]
MKISFRDSEGKMNYLNGFEAENRNFNILMIDQYLDSLQLSKPYKLYNRDWLNYVKALSAKMEIDQESVRLYNLREKIFSVPDVTDEAVYAFIEQHRQYKESVSLNHRISKKVKENNNPQLSEIVSHIMAYGDISNAISSGGVENVLCQLQKQGPGDWHTLDTYYSDYTTGSYYFHIYNYNINADYRVVFKLQNEDGDYVTEDSDNRYIPGPDYIMIDDNWQIVDGWILDFGNIDFYDDGSSQYGYTAANFNELVAVRMKTVMQAGIDPWTVRVEYPSRWTSGSIGMYFAGIIEIMSGYYDVVAHEFGHHVYDVAGAQTINYGDYSLYCEPAYNAYTAFVEGWAVHYRNWTFNEQKESNACGGSGGAIVMLNNRYGIYDLIDSGDDGETAQLYMFNLVEGLYGVSDWASYVTRLKSLFPSSASAINAASNVNGLPTGTLLASTSQNENVHFIESTCLLPNFPNPFNPSTTFSFTIGGNAPQNASLDIFDIRGKFIKQLGSGTREPGKYFIFWDGKDSEGKHISSGIYFYRLVAGDYISIRKMVILK